MYAHRALSVARRSKTKPAAGKFAGRGEGSTSRVTTAFQQGVVGIISQYGGAVRCWRNAISNTTTLIYMRRLRTATSATAAHIKISELADRSLIAVHQGRGLAWLAFTFRHSKYGTEPEFALVQASFNARTRSQRRGQ